MDKSVFSNVKIDTDTPLADYWSNAERAGLDIALVAPPSIASVQVRKGKVDELGETIRQQYAISLPDGPCWSGNGQVEFLGIGPGAWLAVWADNLPKNIDLLHQRSAPAASITDQSSAYRVFRISGSPVKEFLARGLRAGLLAPEFKTNSVLVTSIAHMGVIVWQADKAPTFVIAVARSYNESFCHWIADSIAGVIQAP